MKIFVVLEIVGGREVRRDIRRAFHTQEDAESYIAQQWTSRQGTAAPLLAGEIYEAEFDGL